MHTRLSGCRFHYGGGLFFTSPRILSGLDDCRRVHGRGFFLPKCAGMIGPCCIPPRLCPGPTVDSLSVYGTMPDASGVQPALPLAGRRRPCPCTNDPAPRRPLA
jgi:hypothetical protein